MFESRYGTLAYVQQGLYTTKQQSWTWYQWNEASLARVSLRYRPVLCLLTNSRQLLVYVSGENNKKHVVTLCVVCAIINGKYVTKTFQDTLCAMCTYRPGAYPVRHFRTACRTLRNVTDADNIRSTLDLFLIGFRVRTRSSVYTDLTTSKLRKCTYVIPFPGPVLLPIS